MVIAKPPRYTATITRREPNFAFALDEWGVSYFIHRSGIQLTGPGWDSLHEGTKVELTPLTHPKGPRGIEVKILPN